MAVKEVDNSSDEKKRKKKHPNISAEYLYQGKAKEEEKKNFTLALYAQN